MKIYRGEANKEQKNFIFTCWTEEYEVAEHYYSDNIIEAEIDIDSLICEECDGYDHNTNTTPADDEEFVANFQKNDVDVLIYEDEDEYGKKHTAYKMISEIAVKALNILI